MNVYLCNPHRSAIGRYAGGLANIRPDDLLAQVIRAVLAQCPQLPAESIDDAFFGCANQAGEDNRNVARMATLLAGVPFSVPATTINRLCGSGMDAIGLAYRSIASGEADLILAGGVESMSRAPFVMGKAQNGFDRSQILEDTTMGWRFINPALKQQYGTETMPETAENVAAKFSIGREAQDNFAYQSQLKAATAQASGRFAKEITPVTFQPRKGDAIVIDKDEHIRPQTTLEALAKLKAPFRENGSVTAGNASGINDGASAMLVASEAAVERYNLTPVAQIKGMATAGVEPTIMGVGPVPAVNKLLAKQKLSLDDIGTIELNEAFAAQVLACMQELGLSADDPRVNPNGGAIALGHPLGMSGARLLHTAALQFEQTSADYALCSMCIGVGQGIATLLKRI
ncbi:3-oxoadipyl-CoA thiolase [Paraglaciecola chathamensis]|jgi:3-oxo-5,6-didehydrosuberyl-CoA/3-oxoadipyl-CoA thiolase|uniref:3-oxoadipyl-CoA thiolase n=1 Tax=Paraglaciecola chathamensis TaxID=368405 RepID=A0ABS0W8X8_9ALTE|nr:3-oxoadipyl-CoA thiolase [Paraglaciecola chathamensis]MBJ2135227.1 3-oxoadipyl-CoA thiolase [Paraglaciecola chathamensis]